jgi:hypothetical protein
MIKTTTSKKIKWHWRKISILWKLGSYPRKNKPNLFRKQSFRWEFTDRYQRKSAGYAIKFSESYDVEERWSRRRKKWQKADYSFFSSTRWDLSQLHQRSLSYIFSSGSIICSEYFFKITQSVKLNSRDFAKISTIDCGYLYDQLLERKIPFNKWYYHIQKSLKKQIWLLIQENIIL